MLYRTKIIVRNYHLDGYGHVNNARYLEFLEEARWAVCHGKEKALAWFKQHGLALNVQRIEIDYQRPAFMGEHLMVETTVVQQAPKHWVIRQHIIRQNNDKLIVTANVFLCLVSATQRGALALDGELAEKLQALLG